MFHVEHFLEALAGPWVRRKFALREGEATAQRPFSHGAGVLREAAKRGAAKT